MYPKDMYPTSHKVTLTRMVNDSDWQMVALTWVLNDKDWKVVALT